MGNPIGFLYLAYLAQIIVKLLPFIIIHAANVHGVGAVAIGPAHHTFKSILVVDAVIPAAGAIKRPMFVSHAVWCFHLNHGGNVRPHPRCMLPNVRDGTAGQVWNRVFAGQLVPLPCGDRRRIDLSLRTGVEVIQMIRNRCNHNKEHYVHKPLDFFLYGVHIEKIRPFLP